MNAGEMIALADKIDERLGPISGRMADRLAIDLRATAKGQVALIARLERARKDLAFNELHLSARATVEECKLAFNDLLRLARGEN